MAVVRPAIAASCLTCVLLSGCPFPGELVPTRTVEIYGSAPGPLDWACVDAAGTEYCRQRGSCTAVSTRDRIGIRARVPHRYTPPPGYSAPSEVGFTVYSRTGGGTSDGPLFAFVDQYDQHTLGQVSTFQNEMMSSAATHIMARCAGTAPGAWRAVCEPESNSPLCPSPEFVSDIALDDQ